MVPVFVRLHSVKAKKAGMKMVSFTYFTLKARKFQAFLPGKRAKKPKFLAGGLYAEPNSIKIEKWVRPKSGSPFLTR